MTRQCLARRIPDRETLEQETTAWYIQRNHSQKSVDWQFTTSDARIRLKRLYPQIKNWQATRANPQDLDEAIETLIGGLKKENITSKLWIIQRGRIRIYQQEVEDEY